MTMSAGCVLGGNPEGGPASQGVAAGGAAAIGPARAMTKPKIEAALWPDLRGKPYRPPAAGQAEATQALVEAAMRHALGGDAAPLTGLAERAGVEVVRWTLGSQRYLALLETPSRRGSMGAVVLRMGPAGPAGERLLQAPHTYFDVGTGTLALEVFLARPEAFRGLLANTLHRYVQHDGRKHREDHNPADVCHNDEHPFVAATAGAVAALGAVEVIQLHGFSDDRTLADAPQTVAIVSAGHERGSPRVDQVAARLREAFGVEASRYPADVHELGGTTNVIGRRVRAHPDGTFLHVELSSSFRRELLKRRSDGPQRLAAILAGDAPAPASGRP